MMVQRPSNTASGIREKGAGETVKEKNRLSRELAQVTTLSSIPRGGKTSNAPTNSVNKRHTTPATREPVPLP
ncbi:MAG: hypothetical protein PHS80_14885, partial [Methanothrix sp.]|nr:hypothetical protein [Methanothrix sp.]